MQDNQENHDLQEVQGATQEQENVSIEADNAAESIPSIEEQLRKTELLAAEHHDAWLRAKAETENVRRRSQEDVSKAAKYAIEKFAGELLVVRDGLEQTLAVENATLEAIREGADLTLKNLSKAFEKSGIVEINPLGDKFDPHKHQAISAVPSEAAANTVVQVFQKGYLLEGRVLRPALVAVSNGSPA